MTHFLISSLTLGARTIGDALRNIPPGFDGVEFGVGVEPSEIDHFHAWQQRGGQALAHNYFPPPPEPFVLNLASSDKEILTKSITLCRTAIEFCADHSIPAYSVHAGFCVHAHPADLGRELTQLPRFPKVEARKIFVESLARLARRARELGVGLAVENNVVAPMNLVNGRNELLLGARPQSLANLIYDTGENVSILLDLAHLKVSAQTLDFDVADALEAVKGMVRIVHVSENNGLRDENRLFETRPWFADFSSSHLKSVEYVVLETVAAPRTALTNQAHLLRQTWP